MAIIDTHLHLIEPERFSYPWIAGVPKLAGHFGLDRYLGEATPLGITAMLHMEVDVAEGDMLAETAHVARLGQGVAGAIAACRPEHADFPAQLEALAAIPGVRGVRRILHQSPDELGQSPLFARNVARLAAHGLSFDLCVLARQLPIAAALVRACPDVQFILDHCGVPDVRAAALDPWRADLMRVAALPNVACKISGVVAYGHPTDWTTADLRPFVEHAIAVFGWDRVVWGSDWPVCTLTADLTRWVAATHELLAGCGADERSRLLEHNARRIYRIH